MKSGIYIHIPFCKSRCIYCGFYSTTKTELQRKYIKALQNEIALRGETLRNKIDGVSQVIETIYIGGGTPSILSQEDINDILTSIRKAFICDTHEVTIEMNPDDITKEKVIALRTLGINRISIGIQTFNENRLRFIHRRHTASQALKAVETIREAGIENVNIDLMFGFPDETITEWENDLRTAIEIAPSHISAYSLTYEENTPLYNMLHSGRIKQIDEEVSRAMYNMLIDKLTANGYEHYEISNFSKPGYRSIHNSSYWQDKPYFGFGAAAHSYDLATRSWNVSDITTYINKLENNTLPSEAEIIDEATHYNDLITTTLRTSEGLQLNILKPQYKDFLLQCAQNDISRGLLEITNNHLRITRKGLFVSDCVMSDLIYV